jgi:hypothetical protein
MIRTPYGPSAADGLVAVWPEVERETGLAQRRTATPVPLHEPKLHPRDVTARPPGYLHLDRLQPSAWRAVSSIEWIDLDSGEAYGGQ